MILQIFEVYTNTKKSVWAMQNFLRGIEDKQDQMCSGQARTSELEVRRSQVSQILLWRFPTSKWINDYNYNNTT